MKLEQSNLIKIFILWLRNVFKTQMKEEQSVYSLYFVTTIHFSALSITTAAA